MKRILLSCFMLCTGLSGLFSQVSVFTNHINNNGNGSVTFQVHNTNAYDIIITDISCHLGTSATNNLQLLYNPTPLIDATPPWSLGTIADGQNGWSSAGTATVSSNTANGIVPAITNMLLLIPAGATYTLGFSATTLQYMSLTYGGGINTFSSAGVELLTGDGISWGGTAYPATPANYPRGFIGGITFIPAVPCTAPPTAGITTASANPVCPSTNIILNLSGASMGTGQTYQWQSSPDNISYTDMPGATNYNCTTNQVSDTWYRAIVTCGGTPDTSAPLLITLTPFMNCYCSSVPANASDEEIYNVTVNGNSTDSMYSNANGCSTQAPGPGSLLNRYSNFKTLPALTSVDLGQLVSFSIDENECDGPNYYNNGIGIWIDFNQNGSFTDPGETVFLEGLLAPSPRTVTGSFTVPVNALIGNTAMRIICAEGFYGSGLNPCLNYFYGETEDYLINIQCPALSSPAAGDANICMGNTATLNATPGLTGATISWWDSLTGGTQLATTNTYTTPALSANTSYYAQQDLTGCPSSPRQQVNVLISEVVVDLTPVNVSCNGLNDGTFNLANVHCGTAPFEYSVDGGAFGPIPTDLLAGTYTVMVRDAVLDSSVAYPVTIGEPGPPVSLNVSNTTIFTVTLEWVPQGSETQWTIEYGPAGFTPGTGITVTAASIPWTLYGLTDATDYEFYVAAGCSPSSVFAGPGSFTTNSGFSTFNSDCGPGFIDISTTGTALNLGDDDEVNVTSGFPINLQGLITTDVTISNNGWISLDFGSAYLNAWSLDLDDEEGNVYYETLNYNGDNLFIVQWDNHPGYPGVIGQNVTFEIIINETTSEIFYIYEDVVFGGSQSSDDYCASGTISLEGPVSSFIVSDYDPTYLTDHSCVRFYDTFCPDITNFSGTVLQEDAFFDWDSGPYGETNWTLIYGPQGFDPAANPSDAIDTLYLSSSDASFGGALTQLTNYDVYIYSECQADSVTSDGFLYSFTTLPWCTNPGNIATSVAVDTVFTTWNWTETDPSYPVTGFNLQYGNSGFDLYTGTYASASGTNLNDTIADPGFLSGGVYEIYVQAVCGSDTSAYTGPVSFIMPLTNDDACNAESLVADGTVYTFNNSDATVALGEDSIAPPATGFHVTTGWGNSDLDNTTWFTFTAPASGNIRINNTAVIYNGQVAVYDATSCGVFSTYTLLGANDDDINGGSTAPNFTICGLTPGNTYYLLHDGFTSFTGNYSLSIMPIVLEAGTFTTTGEVCAGADLDLFTTITGNDTGGTWSSPQPAVNVSINGSIFSTAVLASQTFNFEYMLSDGCASDSVLSQVEIFAAPNSGMDGTITACRNQPIDLLSGLNGSADLTGIWYAPAVLAGSQITTSNTPGTYTFIYVTGNGVCPDDTASVNVTVQSCDFMTIEEADIDQAKVYPNPSDGTVFIEWNTQSPFSYTITDVQGKVVRSSGNVTIDAQLIQLDLSELRAGIYFIRLSSKTNEKIFKLVIK